CPPLAATSTTRSDWAQQRVAADQAWPRTRGKGVTVAIVDSGVDASLPQLSGRVTVGADIVTGTGRADTDCLGTGTAMASLIIAQGGAGDLNGTAPDATVMPVRVVTTAGASRAADEVTAIQVAVSAGARVIALGSYVDMTDPAVAAAIRTATGHDVLVVGCAPTATAAPAAARNPSTLQVGGVDTNNNLAAHYQPGSVDVVAPSVNVLTLGVSGTGQLAASGTQYAVAFVAGEAALIRAAGPALTAEQVAQRVKSTADAAGQAQPNTTDGWGFIDPTTAVDLPQAPGTSNQSGTTAPATLSGGRSGTALAILGLVGLAVTLLIGWRVRRTLRSTDEPDDDPYLADETESHLPSAPTTLIPSQPASR
ncbi:MAG TPA: S8 family serine peptidase, partial [Rugosimonospora sp.]|nr:S8 family serine peptidase [Rugosimonospora sp.]